MLLYINKVRKLCDTRKVTQKHLAEKIGASPTGFSQMLSNETMQVKTLQAIADYFKVPIAWFFEDDNTASPHIDVDRVFDVMKEMVKEKMK